VTLDDRVPLALEAIPLKLDYCHTGLAAADDAAWIRHRFRKACHLLGTDVGEHDGRLAVTYGRS
jgi:hypothetical protein